MNLLQIRDKIKRRSGLNAIGAFWTDPELNDYINEAYRYYWQMLFNANHQDALKNTLLDIQDANTGTDVPADFHKVRLLERVAADGLIPLWWCERYQEPVYTAGVDYSSLYAPSYRLERRKIFCEPAPSSTITGGLKLTYWFTPTELVNDIDEPDVALDPLYHDLLVYRGTLLAKSKEEGIGGGGVDLGPWGSLMQDLQQKFKETIELASAQQLQVKPFSDFSDNY